MHKLDTLRDDMTIRLGLLVFISWLAVADSHVYAMGGTPEPEQAACKSFEELTPLRANIEQMLEQFTECQSNADCVLLTFNCPLPCGAAVSRHMSNEIESKSQHYDAQTCDSCTYRCRSIKAAECINNRCTVIY